MFYDGSTETIYLMNIVVQPLKYILGKTYKRRKNKTTTSKVSKMAYKIIVKNIFTQQI
jgi:hypothetical protein